MMKKPEKVRLILLWCSALLTLGRCSAQYCFRHVELLMRNFVTAAVYYENF